MNDGFDFLGAQPFEDHLIGAATPNVQPTVSKLTRAASSASRAAAKLQRINPRAAARLKKHSSTALAKSAALQRAVSKMKATTVQKAKPALASAAKAAAAAHVMSATTSSASASPRTKAAASSARAAGRRMIGLNQALLQSIASQWLTPLLDIYSAFANAVDDAGVAGEVITLVQPMIDQLQAAGQTALVSSGNALIALANSTIDNVQIPPDPQDPSGGGVPGGVGYAWLGDITQAGTDLREHAVAWISQARAALAAVPAAPAFTAPAEQPPAPASAAGPSGGGGSGSGGGGGGADSGGGAPDEGSAPADDGGEGGGEEETPPDEGSVMAPPAEYAADDSGEDQGEYAEEAASEEEDPFADYEGSDVGAELLGRGGHGGGGHGGHGHGGHHGHGGRGRGRGWYGDYGGYYGPWYADPLAVELIDDDEDLADRIAKKVAQKQWAAGHAHVGSGFDALGADELGYAAPETHWYSVATPGVIKDEMDKVLREGNTLDRDIMMFMSGNPAVFSFKDAWSSFWAGYKAFYDDSGWFSRLTSTKGDQVVAYGNQLNDWRARFLKFDGAVASEPDLTDIKRRTDPTKFNYMPLVYGAVAVVGVIGGGYALSKVGAIAALFSHKRTA